jgi:azurin
MKTIIQTPMIKLVLLLVALLLTSACSNARASSGVQLELSAQGDQVAFTQTTLKATASESVSLVFKNSSKALQHNWVLVQGDDHVAKQVSEDALTAGLEQQAIPADKSEILAHTNLVKSGESVKVTFTAPTEPGDYTYLCTFPGHYLMGMKGTLVVER